MQARKLLHQLYRPPPSPFAMRRMFAACEGCLPSVLADAKSNASRVSRPWISASDWILGRRTPPPWQNAKELNAANWRGQPPIAPRLSRHQRLHLPALRRQPQIERARLMQKSNVER